MPDSETLNALYALQREGLHLSVMIAGVAADHAVDRWRYMLVLHKSCIIITLCFKLLTIWCTKVALFGRRY